MLEDKDDSKGELAVSKRWVFIVVAAVRCFLTVAASASAECAWVSRTLLGGQGHRTAMSAVSFVDAGAAVAPMSPQPAGGG